MLTDDLKAAIWSSGKTHYRIGKDAGVSPSVIDRFVSGERDVTLTTASQIAAVLGLGLAKKKPAKSVRAS